MRLVTSTAECNRKIVHSKLKGEILMGQSIQAEILIGVPAANIIILRKKFQEKTRYDEKTGRARKEKVLDEMHADVGKLHTPPRKDRGGVDEDDIYDDIEKLLKKHGLSLLYAPFTSKSDYFVGLRIASTEWDTVYSNESVEISSKLRRMRQFARQVKNGLAKIGVKAKPRVLLCKICG